jgi:C-terminal processing protease CtpA/Prc
MSLEADTYLGKAVNIIKTNALNRQNVDWDNATEDIFAHARHAQKPVETYKAIRYALQKLGDHHSFLLLKPEQIDEERALSNNFEAPTTSSSARTGSTGSSAIEPVKASSIGSTLYRSKLDSKFKQRYQPGTKIIERGRTKIGLLEVPRYWGTSNTATAKTFAQLIQDNIKDLHDQQVQGWIVDLRGNTGGNMWPMLAGVGPLLGAERIGMFKDSHNKTIWHYRNGAAGVSYGGGPARLMVNLPGECVTLSGRFPVAVLIDNDTVSSGEAVTVAFKGRPDTKFFGRHTCGLSTANSGIPLPDGAIIELTVSVDGDRDGNLYDSGIAPDVEIKESESGEADIQAAADWIERWSPSAKI